MANVRFYLRDKNDSKTAIIGKLSYESKKFFFATGYSVNPKNWNQKTQKVSKERNSADINIDLENLSNKILNIYDELRRRGGAIDNNKLKKAYEGNTDSESANKDELLYKHIESVINNRKLNGRNNKRGIDGRVAKYQKTFERLKEFAQLKYKRELTFDDIDLDFYNHFIEWLRNVKELAVATVGGEIKVLKRFLNVATIKGINTNMIFKSGEFKAPDKKVKHITLDEDEINLLYGMDLTGYLEKARDIFIIGCRTGLRVSDYGKCVDDNVSISGLICIDETDKTGEPVYIPMHWQVKRILDKYNGLPTLISDQKLNDYLKELGKKAGFDQQVKDTRQGRNKPAGSGPYCHKYELITTHTARRSCATNMYLAGFDLYFIQGILGHKKIETTIGYLGATRKALALKMVDNPYFKKMI
jgi:integrase